MDDDILKAIREAILNMRLKGLSTEKIESFFDNKMTSNNDKITPEQVVEEISKCFGNTHIAEGEEYGNLKARFQNLWSKVNKLPPSEAPDLHIHENSWTQNAYYMKSANLFGITDETLNELTEEQVDAVLLHEIGHQVLGHDSFQEFIEHSVIKLANGDDKERLHLQYTFQTHELQADSVAVAHGAGAQLRDGLEELDHIHKHYPTNNQIPEACKQEGIVEALDINTHPPIPTRVEYIKQLLEAADIQNLPDIKPLGTFEEYYEVSRPKPPLLEPIMSPANAVDSLFKN